MLQLVVCLIDTAFMYMIGWLCMIKIYQTRHPDVNAHAHSAYCIIAFVVFIGVIGVVSSLFVLFCFCVCCCRSSNPVPDFPSGGHVQSSIFV